MSRPTNTISLPEKTPETFHAPATRLPNAALNSIVETLQKDQVIQSLLDGYPEVAVLLNKHRQIVACNQALLNLLGIADGASIVGQRVGEVLGCIHAHEEPGGCGTSETCQTCGAVNAVLGCHKSNVAVREECRITTDSTDSPNAWDLEVVASPFRSGEMELVIFAARDIASNKRREALERLFFHDTLNIAGGIQGLAKLLEYGEAFNPEVHPGRLHAMSRQLIEQICGQRDLAAAEQGVLTTTWSTIVVNDLFEDLKAAYETHPAAQDRSIVFTLSGDDGLAMQSDRVLLNRVLGNLIKNALEATKPGAQVTVSGGQTDDGSMLFTVHNLTVMPREIQLQVFKRSFSTKGGVGRGLGTFSVQLLTTQNLGGQVEFESVEGIGTTFNVTLPRCQTPDWKPEFASAALSECDAVLKGCRVLLAEDDEDTQKLISYTLKKAGADVTLVENGRLAVEAVLAGRAEQAFDAILMDMQMPVMDGYESTRRLRHQGYQGPIIALTAHGMAGDRNKCIHAGCDDYAVKPVIRKQLIETLWKHVRKPE